MRPYALLLGVMVLFAAPVTPAIAAQTIVAAGGTHACENDGDELTAGIVETIPGTVVPVGDMAADIGLAEEYDCYTPSWGRFMDRTRAVAGNHDWDSGGEAFKAYFAAQLGPARHPTYYAFGQGQWRMYVLDSNCDRKAPEVDCGIQARWLKRQLERHPHRCVGAFFHHPAAAGNPRSQRIFRVLYDAGADLVVTAHRHYYERMANMGRDGADRTGPREFIVGTGGTRRWVTDGAATPGSRLRVTETLGVLKLSLRWNAYGWEFIGTDGAVVDAGTRKCFPGRDRATSARLRR